MKKKLSFLLLTVAALLVALAAGPVFGQGADGLDRADKARQAHTESLMVKAGVVGVALGYNPAGKAAVKVYTEHSDVKGIPHELDGVPVHIVIIGKISALRPDAAPAVAPNASHTTAKFPRPVPIGVSTGHPDITAGTIGARVVDDNDTPNDPTDDTYYALSNNHVYANQNDASNGDAVIQPGSYDGGSSSADDIGTLADFEDIVFSTSANNVIDAAIASTTMALVGNSTPPDGYGTPNSTTVAAFPGLKVMKYGRTTIETKGRVDSINATLFIGYGGGTARFVDQIVITPGRFSAGGDSGSLIVTQDGHNPVGLLYAGSSRSTIANPIDAVLSRFGVTIDDSPPPPETTGSISGTVEDDSSIAIEGATVSVDTGQWDDTAADGSYTITGVPTGNRSVTATADGFNSQNTGANVAEDQMTAVDFALAETATGIIAGAVTNANGGAGISGATVVVEGTGLSATTDGSGDYSIAGVPTGNRSVTASATGFDSETTGATVNDGATTSDVDFTLAASTVSALDVTVATDGTTYVKRDTVTITANVTDGEDGPAVGGATVRIVITTPRSTLACNPVTNGSGVAICTYKVNPNRDGVGTYNVVATATKAGFDSGSHTTTFEVK